MVGSVVPVESFVETMPDLVTPGPLAIFDLDRTLHSGSGLGVLARHAFRSRLIGPHRMVRSLVHDLVFRKRGSTDDHINSIAELALDMAGGVTLTELDPVVRATAEEIALSVRPPMRALLDLHRDAGHYSVLLSASPQVLVEQIADLLEIDRGIGTIIGADEGVLTGSIVPPMCYGPGKIERLVEVVGWPTEDHLRTTNTTKRTGSLDNLSSPTDGPYTYAYADSMSDLPLLEAVHAPFVVAPDRRLRQLAADRSWPILDA